LKPEFAIWKTLFDSMRFRINIGSVEKPFWQG
jgi:hypothetical protein